MTHLRYALLLASHIAVAGLAIPDVNAQSDAALSSPRANPMPLDPAGPKVAPAPEWSVWRAFYSSLEFYGRRSPHDVEALLAERAALTSAETAAVLEAGLEYLQQLSVIDDAARAEVRSRFQLSDAPPMPLARVQRPAQLRQAPEGLRPKDAQGGLSTYEVLVAEGFVARVQEQKQEILRAHKERLAGTIHPAKLASIEHWINRDIAPSVKVVTQATLLSAPPSVGSPLPR
jgi:hypothetical protein